MFFSIQVVILDSFEVPNWELKLEIGMVGVI